MVATSYTWNVKQKVNGMGQNTLHCCYGNYVITNQEILINKRYCSDFVSLPCQTCQNLLFVIGFS